jgi:GT2 family glycosyltransferase
MTQGIAVLIACYNRRETTLRCLDALFRQQLPAGFNLATYLVDDGCTDGTGAAVQATFPDVNLIVADGSLYWSGGMRFAWEVAARADPDFYLWLNDDTCLLPGCLGTLLATWKYIVSVGKERCIVIGSCCDPQTGELSYGGRRKSCKHPAKLILVPPDPVMPRACETFNGNCVLVPREAFKVLGFMRRFQHSMSDSDYGLLAIREGIQVAVAPGILAECVLNPILEHPHSAWQNRALPRLTRWKILLARKGLPPVDWWRYLWTHAGLRALWYWPTDLSSGAVRPIRSLLA